MPSLLTVGRLAGWKPAAALAAIVWTAAVAAGMAIAIGRLD